MKLGAWAGALPWSIVLLAAVLVAAGWLGIARAEEFSGGSGRFLWRQVAWSVLAVAAMLLMTVPNYRIFCRYSYAILVVSLVLLVVVFFSSPVNGARRWIRIGPLGMQPSEFAKVAFVLALARYLMYRENYRRFWGLVLPVALAMVPVLLILREPDLGTALVFLPVLFVMLFAAGARRIDLTRLALLSLAAVPFLWTQMSGEQKSRVTALFHQAGPGEGASEETYQLRQAKQMAALGGVWGSLLVGQAVDDRGVYHLPEARSDFIFCVLGERLGLLGTGMLLGAFALLVWRGLAIAQATREPFGRLVAVGLVALLAVQVLINTGMTVGLLPVVGLSLPLVSYGGSGLLAQGLLLGLLVNIGLRPGYEVTKEPFRYVVRPIRSSVVTRA